MSEPVVDLRQHLAPGERIYDDFCNGYFGRDWCIGVRWVEAVGRDWAVLRDADGKVWILGWRIDHNPSAEDVAAWKRPQGVTRE